MKPLALLVLLLPAAGFARAGDDPNPAQGAADAAQSARAQKAKWGAPGAQTAPFAAGEPEAALTPDETLSTWSHACPAIAAYRAMGTRSKKKGLGITSRYAPGPELLSDVGASWYYTWTAVPAPGAGGEFVPLLQYPRSEKDYATLKKDLGNLSSGTREVLGFNEPDVGPKLPADTDPPPTTSQAEATLERLLPMIPKAVRDGARLASPALASPVLYKDGRPEVNPWQAAFMEDAAAKAASAPDRRVDFIATHLYSAIDIEKNDSPEAAAAKVAAAAENFVKRLRTLEAAYPAKEIWITEMGLMDGAAKDAPIERFGPKDDACFMARVLPVLDSDPRVERYAWFNADADAKKPLYPTLPGTLFSRGKQTPLALLYKQ